MVNKLRPREVKMTVYFHSIQFSQSCLTLCNPTDWSISGLPVHHQLLELAQTHVHLVSDAIQPSHPVVPFSSHPQFFPASGSFQMSQLFASGGQSIGASASVLPMNIQDWFPLGYWFDLLAVQRTLQKSSPTPQFKTINSSALSLLNGPALTSVDDYWENHSFEYIGLCYKVMSLLF